MARSRNIKPGFFKNELLAELPFEYRILFQGLWCHADRDGRLEDRPKRLKAEIFPYDDVDVDAGLSALAAKGFIVRYEAEGVRCIEVVNFARHQNPHKKEAPSNLPVRAQEIPGQAPEIPERARLIPDSGFLITEAKASDAGASAEQAPDPIWGTGLAFLRRKGIPEKQARSLLGKIRQAVGDIEAGAILAQAEAQEISDPAPWLMAAAKRAREGPKQPLGKQAQGVMALEEMKRDRMARSGNPDGAATAGLLVAGPDSRR